MGKDKGKEGSRAALARLLAKGGKDVNLRNGD